MPFQYGQSLAERNEQAGQEAEWRAERPQHLVPAAEDVPKAQRIDGVLLGGRDSGQVR